MATATLPIKKPATAMEEIWGKEVQARVQAYKEGRLKGVSLAEFKRQMTKRLAK